MYEDLRPAPPPSPGSFWYRVEWVGRFVARWFCPVAVASFFAWLAIVVTQDVLDGHWAWPVRGAAILGGMVVVLLVASWVFDMDDARANSIRWARARWRRSRA